MLLRRFQKDLPSVSSREEDRRRLAKEMEEYEKNGGKVSSYGVTKSSFIAVTPTFYEISALRHKHKNYTIDFDGFERVYYIVEAGRKKRSFITLIAMENYLRSIK